MVPEEEQKQNQSHRQRQLGQRVKIPTLQSMLYNIESAHNQPIKGLTYMKKLYNDTDMISQM